MVSHTPWYPTRPHLRFVRSFVLCFLCVGFPANCDACFCVGPAGRHTTVEPCSARPGRPSRPRWRCPRARSGPPPAAGALCSAPCAPRKTRRKLHEETFFSTIITIIFLFNRLSMYLLGAMCPAKDSPKTALAAVRAVRAWPVRACASARFARASRLSFWSRGAARAAT